MFAHWHGRLRPAVVWPQPRFRSCTQSEGLCGRPENTHQSITAPSQVQLQETYRKTRKFNLRLIFAISAEANRWKLKASNFLYFSNDVEENWHLIVKIKWSKMSGWANQWNFISAKCSRFTVYSSKHFKSIWYDKKNGKDIKS